MIFTWSALAEHVVSRLLASLPSDVSAVSASARRNAERLSALPIGCDMWSEYYLRPNGEVVVIGEDLDQPDVDTVYSDWSRVLRVLVWGSERYPELRQLLPVRGPDAVDCRCRAVPMFAEGKMLCPECDGLGWIEPDTTLPQEPRDSQL